MTVVLSAVALILAGAVVLLFAMMGELASRIPEAEPDRPWIRKNEDVLAGRLPDSWPPELAGIPARADAVLVVLSTVCNSCRAIAGQLAAHTDWADVALVVSTPASPDGHDFIAEFGLGSVPHFVDHGGDWVRRQFGVQSSPTAVALRAGRSVGGYSFSDALTLRTRISGELAGEPGNNTDTKKEAANV